ncbi:MAG: carbohydrate ABC transporter permease [Actinobacteria bacterium]|nr:carbohydrate ABC transporter permease [Actinomycetota bacterium]
MAYAVRQGFRYALVVVVLGIVIVPFLWVFLASFRPNSELIQQGIGINLDTLTLDNYRNLQQAAQYFTYLTNSAIVAVTSMIVSITLALLAAYSVYRTMYPGRRPLYLALIITYVFPGVVLLIPLYQLMIEEAAAIDGAGRMRILFSIVLPLTAPGIAAAAIFSFVWSWTEYMFASAFIVDEGKKTLPVGLGAFIQQYNIDWGILTAAAVATAVPVIVVFAFIGRYFVEGLTAGAEK